MKRIALVTVALTALAMSGCVAGTEASDEGADQEPTIEKQVFPTREVAESVKEGRSTKSITYHGGPVMTNGTNIYYIWYGNWGSNSAKTILTDFASNIGGSGYWNINTTYYSGSGSKTYVKNQVTYKTSTNVTSSSGSSWQGTSLSDAKVLTVVQNVISSGALGSTTPDANGIYFLLTSSEVTESSGFCSQYCGWHTDATFNGVDLKYSFVGNPDQCPSSCEDQTTGPNGNAGADGMASIIAHEAEEATTDPDVNAWFDSSGAENGDKCAWTFGSTYSSGGALANVHLGSRDYLIQQNWNASSQSCAMSH